MTFQMNKDTSCFLPGGEAGRLLPGKLVPKDLLHPLRWGALHAPGRMQSAPTQSVNFYNWVPALIVLSCLFTPAQGQRNMNPETYYRPASTMHGKTVVLPAGTCFEGRMDNSVGSKISHQGERFTVTLASPVLANGTDVIIPAGAQVVGEVVEAIPSAKLPHEKKHPPLNGKLRVQLNTLQTPDGVSYPLVASMAGETIQIGRRSINNPSLGSGVGYMGSTSSFEAVAPGMADRYRGRGGRGPQVVTKQQMMRDAIYGMANNNPAERMASPTIRSLVKRDHDLFIFSGSPITIRLDAPFKIGMNQANPGAITPVDYANGPSDFPTSQDGSGMGRRFSPTALPTQQEAPNAFPGESKPGDTGSGGIPATSRPAAPSAPAEGPAGNQTSGNSNQDNF